MNIVPTDEELAIMAGASREAIQRLAEKRLEQSIQWKGLDHEPSFNAPDIFRGPNGQIINQLVLSEAQLKKLKQEPWWDDFCGESFSNDDE